MPNTYVKIRQSMRATEVELLAFMRKHEVRFEFLGRLSGAFTRLQDAGMIVYKRKRGELIGRYELVRGARPVTPAMGVK